MTVFQVRLQRHGVSLRKMLRAKGSRERICRAGERESDG